MCPDIPPLNEDVQFRVGSTRPRLAYMSSLRKCNSQVYIYCPHSTTFHTDVKVLHRDNSESFFLRWDGRVGRLMWDRLNEGDPTWISFLLYSNTVLQVLNTWQVGVDIFLISPLSPFSKRTDRTTNWFYMFLYTAVCEPNPAGSSAHLPKYSVSRHSEIWWNIAFQQVQLHKVLNSLHKWNSG